MGICTKKDILDKYDEHFQTIRVKFLNDNGFIYFVLILFPKSLMFIRHSNYLKSFSIILFIPSLNLYSIL